jgi:hypothetical protein
MQDPLFSDPNAHHLSHEEAKIRDAFISKVERYDLCLNLFKEKHFEGHLVINLSTKAGDTFLDFHGDTVKSVKVNG